MIDTGRLIIVQIAAIIFNVSIKSILLSLSFLPIHPIFYLNLSHS